MTRSSTRYLSSMFAATLLAGCAAITEPPVPPESLRLKNPTHLPKPVITNFTEALACMDDLMLVNQVTPIYLSTPQITNFTSDRSISTGSTEMLISALSKMSVRSGGVRYVSFGPEVQNVLTLQGAHPNSKSFRAPDFFIRGGLTEFNKNLWSGQNGAGISYEYDPGKLEAAGLTALIRGNKDYTKSYSRNATMGTLTMDLNAGFIANLQIIPGISSSNSLALEGSVGSTIQGDLALASLGISYSLSENISEDFNQVLRSLIQVGVIEIIGKLQGVPYWRCLANAGVVAEQDTALRAKFLEHLKGEPEELARVAQRALAELKYYSGEINGRVDLPTQEAIQRYQQQMGLLATGVLTYETFRMLNIYTPARTEPYVPWWQNYNAVERAVLSPKIQAPKTAEPPAAGGTPDHAKTAPSAAAMPPKPAASQPAAKAEDAKETIPLAWRKMGPLTQKRLAQSQNWLAQTPDDRWFVQLLRSNSEQPQEIDKFLEAADRLLGADRVYVYFVKHGGTDHVGIVAGDYASESEALTAVRNLPAELSANRPFPRQMRRLR